MKNYLIVMSGGVEVEKVGPFDSTEDQIARAKEIWTTLDPMSGDNIFWMDLEQGDVHVGAFSEGVLDKDERAI
jgi:hypothetical protein